MGQPSSLLDAPGKANLWINLSNWNIYGNRIVGMVDFLARLIELDNYVLSLPYYFTTLTVFRSFLTEGTIMMISARDVLYRNEGAERSCNDRHNS